ncbi:endonuclease/exonuclease/phosphatase family protein [Providencia sp. PROV188]|jgi:endonuclease/exonuclease/phosphatase family metal-dependent hydrolase|uniref:Endonuclease/exonuclease/phosphatase family metal-dependent hydrolase n=1 Tax=Providencia alcalifaciens TaxID=126385 RepID=A0A4R3NSJ0_9GAMM|nr:MULTISPECIES: endonuclease/exonuclease/phosphatase family protein [Providencia]ETS99595.1 endonuclease/exonuclease/phosphatase family protein [Providencia alcalifaciens PAL-3]EUD00257.1 endonuclease/exonuclease/phosphatase family protein [Providencia alcalifaciens PAL-1]MBC5790067.1 endonuclease/exonuclease/phosphatase family protein [Providencia sp. JUb39]MBG5881818.1 endonuclease/exonuclease/phosphatase family protein [Providencia alcalifaciens]MDR2243779.1 endonuclease/exonuclease/phosph
MKSIKTLVSAAILVSCGATAATTGSEVLMVQNGGTPNKVYSANKPTIKVATYNIGKNELAADVANLDELSKAIAKIDADVIVLTEIDNKTARSKKVNQLEEIAKANKMDFAFGKALDFDGGEYGVGILSKYKIEKSQVVNLPSGGAEQRVVLLSQITKPGFDSPIIIMGTHLDWQKDPTIRIGQVRHILDATIGDTETGFDNIAASIKILAGDFNSTAKEQPIQEISYFWDPVEKKGVNYRTWPAVNPAIDIDHIFTYKGQVWDVKTMTIPTDSKDFQWSKVSDHLPVIAELELQEQ